MKTIRKNQKKAREIFEKENIECTCYSLSYNFVPAKEIPKEVVKKALYENDHAKLIEDTEGVAYTVQVHSNLWYEIIVQE